MKRCSALVRAPLLLAVLLAAGCATTGPAPVDDLSSGVRRPVPDVAEAPPRPTPPAAPGHHRVQRGDTLYSIAFRHGVDYRDLAAWNGIAAPYTIHVDQQVRTTPPATPRATASRPPAAASAATAVVARRPAEPPVPEPFETVEPAVAGEAAAAAPAESAVASAPAAVVASTPAPSPAVSAPAPVVPAPPAATPPPAESNAAGDLGWRWPAEGSLIARYAAGDPTRQGIDIGGSAGDPVRASANGTVVYSGNGLIGYGELIIVKHNASYLSAYGRNRKRLVKEGERVAAGQVIAEMGSTGASRDSLHFEIRRNGKPVDPLGLLPRR